MRQFSAIKGLRIPSRNFSKFSARLQEQIDARPVISESLRAKIEKNRTRIAIQANVTKAGLNNYEYERNRVVPTLKTFFGGNPVHDENMNVLNAILRKYINLPTRVLSDEELRSNKFISFENYKNLTQSGTRLKDIHYKELTNILHRLRTIDHELMPREVTEVLEKYRSTSNDFTGAAKKLKTLDEFGRAFGKAKRKVSRAQVYLTKGTGETLINGKSLIEYFSKDTDRKKIAYPFQVISQEGQYNIFATVSGGGVTGQVESIMYAIAKALVVTNPLLKPRLSKAGLMTSDSRVVERKKPGKVKARKSPTWVKR
ncbi:mitochondrial ribosomal protein S9 [Scheffersomyces xylosifermentans]|uniref:mitochondrial ribosomal protein S9 n=1 Tax=Scheffersomyces xylosifermentans TaxID=1304137 RepID=UPI00315D4D98